MAFTRYSDVVTLPQSRPQPFFCISLCTYRHHLPSRILQMSKGSVINFTCFRSLLVILEVKKGNSGKGTRSRGRHGCLWCPFGDLCPQTWSRRDSEKVETMGLQESLKVFKTDFFGIVWTVYQRMEIESVKERGDTHHWSPLGPGLLYFGVTKKEEVWWETYKAKGDEVTRSDQSRSEFDRLS